jgi:myo-inositol 2-dehydrogenase/D-chiro-inositol 1-dehydrogenase
LVYELREEVDMMNNEVVRVGVIGVGRIGRLHTENLVSRVQHAKVIALADINQQAAREVAGRWNLPRVTGNYREILDDPQIDAVVICSSTDTHAQLIGESAAAGKHIFCEKPVDLNLQRIDAALGAVQSAGVKLQIGFNRRFDPNFRKVREMVVEGKIGEPHIIRITSRDPAPPPLDYVKVSGGIFLDMTIHDFDMARYLLGCEVEEIFTTGAVLVDPTIGAAGDVDTAVVTLRFANGALGVIDNSRRAVYGYDQRVEVFGSAGMVTVSNNTPDTHCYSNAEGVFSAKPLYFFLERYTESFITEMQAFINSVRLNTTPPVSGLDGRIPVVMGMAAKRSLAENRPVRLCDIA